MSYPIDGKEIRCLMTSAEKVITDRFSFAEGSNQGSRQVVDKFWQAKFIWTKSIPLFGEKSTPDLGEHCHHRSFVKDLKIEQFHLSAQKNRIKKQIKKDSKDLKEDRFTEQTPQYPLVLRDLPNL